MQKKLISIITPVYNEEENIPLYYERMTHIVHNLSEEYDFEFVITDNNSTDKSFALLKDIAWKDPRFRIFRFSKNFGYQKSIFTGYLQAKGNAAIEFDCDLQDPPELLPQFLEEWEKGYKIIYGIRNKRAENRYITFLRKVFYRMLNSISDSNLPIDAGDFMLLDSEILHQLKHIDDHYLYIRGIIFGFGFKQKGIIYERNARIRGQSKFPFFKMLDLAMDGIVSQSTLPLKIASYIGIFVSLLTLLLSGFYILMNYTSKGSLPAGFTTTTVLILFSISLNAIFLGIIGEYMARIYHQVRKRPMTIIEEKIDNFYQK